MDWCVNASFSLCLAKPLVACTEAPIVRARSHSEVCHARRVALLSLVILSVGCSKSELTRKRSKRFRRPTRLKPSPSTSAHEVVKG